jgi:WD40 repeat protein
MMTNAKPKYRKYAVIVCTLAFLYALLSPVHAQPIKTIINLAWSPDATQIIEAGTDGLLRVRDVDTGSVVFEVSNLTSRQDAVSWNSEGTLFASLSAEDGILRIWDVSRKQLLGNFEVDKDIYGRAFVAWSPDGKWIATALFSESGQIRIWRLTGSTLELIATSSAASYYGVAWSPQSDALFVGSFAASYIMYNFESGVLEGRLVNQYPALAVAWNPNGLELAQSLSDGSIMISDAKSGSQILTIAEYESPVGYLFWNVDGSLLISYSNIAGTAKVLDTSTGRSTATYNVEVLPSVGASAIWSPYGGRLAHVNNDTSDFTNSTYKVEVPIPSRSRLQQLVVKCTNGKLQEDLSLAVEKPSLIDFLHAVSLVDSTELSSACASDMLAIANAIERLAD